MSLTNTFKSWANSRTAVIALTTAVAGCTSMPTIRDVQNLPIFGGSVAPARPHLDGLAAVHPSIKPRSCVTYEQNAMYPQNNYATDRGLGELAGAAVAGIFGDKRGARYQAQRGIEGVVTGAGQTASTQAALNAQWQLCARDLHALFQPGGQCAQTTDETATVATINGRIAGDARGRIVQSQNCISAGAYRGPSLMVR